MKETENTDDFPYINWNLEMYKLYSRQVLISIKEYNEKIVKMKKLSEVITLKLGKLKNSVTSYNL